MKKLEGKEGRMCGEGGEEGIYDRGQDRRGVGTGEDVDFEDAERGEGEVAPLSLNVSCRPAVRDRAGMLT